MHSFLLPHPYLPDRLIEQVSACVMLSPVGEFLGTLLVGAVAGSRRVVGGRYVALCCRCEQRFHVLTGLVLILA